MPSSSSSSSKSHEYYYVEDEASVGQIERYLQNPNVVEIRRIGRPHKARKHSSSSSSKRVKKKRASSSSSAGGKKKSSCKMCCIIGWILALIFLGLFIGYLIAYLNADGDDETVTGTTTASPPFFVGWPDTSAGSPYATRPTAEIEDEAEFVNNILTKLTLEEKVAQMMQPALNVSDSEIAGFKFGPGDMATYGIGSMLNGGGGWPRTDAIGSGYLGLSGEVAFTCPGCIGYASSPRAYARLLEELHTGNETYWQQRTVENENDRIRIPFMYATDAVHGHNNAYGSTLFPHNIGLGAMFNAALMEDIGAATAKEVTATAMDWTFAPAVSVPRFDTWGRTYEGYCEDSALVYDYAKYMVKGIQGAGSADLPTDDKVISNIKHFLGDGGTMYGTDRGINQYSEDDLVNIHGGGYFSGLEAGAQVVMASFNSWNNVANYDPIPDDGLMYNGKLHGSQYILTDVLKDRMGFDGIVVTDWNGHTEINGCTSTECNQLIIAGVDIVMIPEEKDWKTFMDNTVAAVNKGSIDMDRIDDAVSRILRVKYRAGLWDRDSPLGVACHSPDPVTKLCSTETVCTFVDGDTENWSVQGENCGRANAGSEEILGNAEHMELARQAVRESLVLLKNEDSALPIDLATKSRICIDGSASKDWAKINGGWTLTWQGGDADRVLTQMGPDGDFSHAVHPSEAIQELLTSVSSDATVVYGSDVGGCAAAVTEYDYVIAMIGEDPYAEMIGDIGRSGTMEFKSMKSTYLADSQVVTDARTAINDAAAATKLVTIFFSGRPLYVNEEINASDAFIAAWLPGSAAGYGITDVIISVASQENYDFVGRLPRTWPKEPCHWDVRSHPTFIQDTAWTPPKFERTYDDIAQWNIDNPEDLVNEPWQLGYGLTYAYPEVVQQIVVTPRNYGCMVPDPELNSQEPEANFVLYPEGSTFLCSEYRNQYDGATMQKNCSCFGAADNECGMPTTGLQVVGGSDDTGKFFTFNSTAVTNVDWNKQAFVALPTVSDISDYYYSEGYVSFDITPAAALNLNGEAVGIGFTFGSPNAAFEMSDKTYVDIQTIIDQAVADTPKPVCVPLACFNDGNNARNWYELAQSFVFETSAAIDVKLSNFTLTTPVVSGTPCPYICDGLATYPSYKQWVNRGATVEMTTTPTP